jgi:hypothetical protein
LFFVLFDPPLVDPLPPSDSVGSRQDGATKRPKLTVSPTKPRSNEAKRKKDSLFFVIYDPPLVDPLPPSGSVGSRQDGGNGVTNGATNPTKFTVFPTKERTLTKKVLR